MKNRHWPFLPKTNPDKQIVPPLIHTQTRRVWVWIRGGDGSMVVAVQPNENQNILDPLTLRKSHDLLIWSYLV